MGRFIWLVFLVALPASAAELLTPAQKRDVLSAIQTICYDTWCEGEYDFRFPSLTCERITAVCRVGVELRYEGKGTPHVCEVDRIRRVGDLIRGKGGRASLTERVYRVLTDCVSSLEPEG